MEKPESIAMHESAVHFTLILVLCRWEWPWEHGLFRTSGASFWTTPFCSAVEGRKVYHFTIPSTDMWRADMEGWPLV